MAHGQGGAEIRVDQSPTLTCNHEAPILVQAYRTTGNSGCYATGDKVDTLGTATDPNHHVLLAPPPYAFQPRIARNGRGDMGELVNALTAQAGETGKGDAAPCVAYAVGEAVAFTQNCRDEVRLINGDGQIAGALAAQGGSHQTNYVAVMPFDTTQVTSPSNYSSPEYGDPCHPLAAGAHPPAVCVTGDVTHCLKAEGFDASEDGTGRGQPIVCGFQSSQSGVRLNPTAGTLDANYGSRRHNGALVEMAVRRLMPVECERLQGFPTVVELDVEQMTRDEVIIAALLNKDIIVDTVKGIVYGTRGPGGMLLAQPRELGCVHPSGYIVINLTANSVKKQVRVHRVIWMSVFGLIPEGFVPDHINNDKSDNRLDNLQLLTGADNSKKAHAEGRIDYDASGATTLTVEVRRQLYHDYMRGGGSYRDMAAKYGISKSRIGQIVQEYGWTEVPNAKGKLAADGPRYKQCGNSMAVPCMRWIGERIDRALNVTRHNGGPPLDDDFDSLLCDADDFDGLLL